MFDCVDALTVDTVYTELVEEGVMMRIIAALFATALVVSYGQAWAATGTWTGTISDSSCGASHDAMTEHGKKASDKQCTQMCVMKGAKYVFVNDGKVLMIKNQNFADLKKFAGDRVTVTGDLAGDTVTLTKVTAAK
jgi:hypothetical protein